MDMSNYKKEFLSEAEEHINILNECLLLLEKNHSDQESVNKLFRSFHTLKGNSAAMGYKKYSELAHALENVLSKIRDKKLSINKNVMDYLFEGCDILEEGLSKIDEDDSENINGEELIVELEDLKEDSSSAELDREESFGTRLESKIVLSNEEQDLVNQEGKDRNVFRTVIIFDSHNSLKKIKASLALKLLHDISAKIIKINPPETEIKEKGFFSEIEIVHSLDKSKEDVEKAINKISGIKHVFVLGLDEDYAKPAEISHEEKEKEKHQLAQKHQKDVVQKIQSVKVSMNKLDKLMNLVGELLISNIRLQDINNRSQFDLLRGVLEGIDRLILELQDEVIEVRMVPIGKIFNRFPRMVRDLAGKEGKNIDLVIEGSEIEFDRTVLDQIGDPLVHLLRNSVDHGIENPDDREKAGKPRGGTIRLVSRREKNSAIIEVSDDGAGIDVSKIKETSIKKGIVTESEAESMSDRELRRLIFRPGLSTKKVITAVSGRGVGMDVVLSKIKELGGNVKISSEVGKGTKITMQLPLTVAIITALLIEVNKILYAIPLTTLHQTVDLDRSKIKTIRGEELFMLRDEEVPLLWLHKLMNHPIPEGDDNLTVVIVNKENEKIGLVVDNILYQQQVLIKSLSSLKNTKGFAGATILGDGTVVLIIDVNTLI